MDPLTIVGVLLAFIAIFAAMIMEGGSPAALFLIPSLLLVFVGTFGVGMAGMTKPDFLRAIKSAKNAFIGKESKPDQLVETIVKAAETARREGLLALESQVQTIEEPLLKRGLELAIDGTDPDALAEVLEAEVAATFKRGQAAGKLFESMGGYAPTIGIIGTVMGLVNVLGNLENPGELGHLIAGAFIATLWGVLSANVLWLPMGSKLKAVNEAEHQRNEMIVEGVLAIQAGANPRMVDQKLRALLPPSPASEKKAA
ncbi:MAG: flagellar motor protein [Actinobacteria bacterium]|jgi:chemotaxis protein MotA|nr:flagellar motor protein [Actinomycetota bacterium]